jgi:HD-like signal output (HDOD) protein
MLPQVLTRLASKTPFASAAIRAEVAAMDAPSVRHPTPTAAAVAPILGGDLIIHDEVEAGSDVRRSLRTSLAELEQSLDSTERRGDALGFFERLAKSGEKTVRQPPAAAQRALDLMRREVAIPALVRLVEQDPVLAQSLLRFANSAAYNAGAAQSTSLAECIRRVGSQGMRSVILSSMVEGSFCRPGSAYDAMVRQVWEHMVRTAPIARALAPGFGIVPDEAFTLALLHDVGKLVVFDRLGTMRAELRREVQLNGAVLPRVLKSLHEALGGAAALRWGLGSAAVAVVSAHHRSGESPAVSPHAECVFLAERLDLALVRGQEPNLARWFEEGRLQANFELVAPIVDRLCLPAAEEARSGSVAGG